MRFFRQASAPVTTASHLPTGSLLKREPRDLLAEPVRSQLLARLVRLAGVSGGHWKLLYEPALHNFAAMTQEVPASESHHHAHVGGLLTHTLEVCVTALNKRAGYVLPPNTEPERVAREQDRWTYAVFLAALVHDVGKPFVDQEIAWYDKRGDLVERGMPIGRAYDPRSAYYTFSYRRDRRYLLHGKIAPVLLPAIAPAAGLSWLAEDTELLDVFLSAVTGDYAGAGVLGEIISFADSWSVSQALGADPAEAAARGRSTPLHLKLLTALRQLIEKRELPLNRDRAAGWVIGDDVWMMATRTAQALREALLQEGHSGIPQDNSRIFDILQEHKLVVPNGDRAVWSVRIASRTWRPDTDFTCLRVPVSVIWPGNEAGVERYGGEASMVGAAVTAGATASGPAAMGQRPVHAPTAAVPPAIIIEGSSPQPQPMEESAPAYDNSRKSVNPGSEIARTGSVVSTPRVELPAQDDKRAPKKQKVERVAGTAFLEWVRQGLATKKLACNRVDAKVHIVPEGVLLVSPVVFRLFANEHPEYGTWEEIQRDFQKMKVNVKTEHGANVFEYTVTGKKGAASIVKGWIVEPGLVFKEDVEVPPVNTHLTLFGAGPGSRKA